MDIQPSAGESLENDTENDQMSAVNLRRIRANLSPVNKTNPLNERPPSLERPQPFTRHSLGNKPQFNRNSNEATNQIEIDNTTNAANKGPPPLPPKPKVLPTKPSNWGFNISDQSTLQ